MKLNKLYTLLLVIITLNSCVGDTDFDQVDDLLFDPIFNISILFFNAQEADFPPPPLNFISDETVFTIFDNDFAQENIVKIEFLFEIENTLNKNFDIVYFLLDEFDVEVGRITLNILNNSTFNNRPAPDGNGLNPNEIFTGTNLQNLLLAQKVRVELMATDTGPQTTSGSINFKSAANIYFEVNVDEN
jgi:hypothetical protein